MTRPAPGDAETDTLAAEAAGDLGHERHGGVLEAIVLQAADEEVDQQRQAPRLCRRVLALEQREPARAPLQDLQDHAVLGG